jgi:hypothetical protein
MSFDLANWNKNKGKNKRFFAVVWFGSSPISHAIAIAQREDRLREREKLSLYQAGRAGGEKGYFGAK